ncbi:hypothetical protein JVU11DRAFT_7807 [Chiua virens]|nr:hypothetical protein JVU11DRAFT_7807 [Chiua virens]
MHQCLTIVEVQHVIFREVLIVDHWDQWAGRATLAGLARTCRTFSDAALDILWEDLPSFAYLIRCLPSSLWKINQTNQRMSFERAMSLSDWEIFFRYSSRVRSISAFPYVNEHSNSCRSLGTDVIFALSRPPHYGPLVPHLKTLVLDSDKESEPLLRLLLTDSLVDATLPFFALHSPTMSIQLTSRCPSLKRLSIRNLSIQTFDDIPDVDKHRIAQETILRLPHSLESLDCTAVRLDEATIAHLSHLPSLTHLTLELQVDLQLENLRPHLTPLAFGSLESLTVAADTLSIVTSFWNSCTSRRDKCHA